MVGKRWSLLAAFICKGKDTKRKSAILLGEVLREEEFHVGPFVAPRGLWINFLHYFYMHLILWFYSFTVFFAGNVLT